MALRAQAFGPETKEQRRAASRLGGPGVVGGVLLDRLSGRRSFGGPPSTMEPKAQAEPLLEFPAAGTPLVPQAETPEPTGGGDLSQLPGFQAATEPGGVAETPSPEDEGPTPEQQAQLRRLLEPDQTTEDLRKALTGGSVALKGVNLSQQLLDALRGSPTDGAGKPAGTAAALGRLLAASATSVSDVTSSFRPTAISYPTTGAERPLPQGEPVSGVQGTDASGVAGAAGAAGAAQAVLSLARLFMQNDRSNADLMASLSSIPAIIGTASTIASANPYAAAVAAAINNALATYQTFEQGTWEKEPGLALTQIAMSPISGFLGGGGNAMMEHISEAWTGEQAWRSFAKELAANEGQQGRGFGVILDALPYVQSKDELARLIGEARNYVATTTGITPELKSVGPYALSSIPGTTGTEHGVAQPRVDWAEPTRQLQALLDAYAPLLPGPEPTGSRLTPETRLRLWSQFMPEGTGQVTRTTQAPTGRLLGPDHPEMGDQTEFGIYAGAGQPYDWRSEADLQGGFGSGVVSREPVWDPATGQWVMAWGGAGAPRPPKASEYFQQNPLWTQFLQGGPGPAPESAGPTPDPLQALLSALNQPAPAPDLSRLLAAARRSRTGTPLVPEAFQDTLDPAALNRLLAQAPQLARALRAQEPALLPRLAAP